MVPSLAETAGILHVTPRYVFMPDDPALGEFRATFGGKPGTIEEYPLPGPDGATGFAGATAIVSTGELWKRHLAGTARVDGRALLRARLFDLWIGDWDRHNKQWRWLQRGEGRPFEPLPEDRDQAFSKFGGLLLSMARATHPKFMDWKDHYENFEGFMTQGGEVDRWLLSEMDRRPSWRPRPTSPPASPTRDRRRRAAPAAGVVRDRRSEPGRGARSAAPRCRRPRASSTRASPDTWTCTPPTPSTPCAYAALATGASSWRSGRPERAWFRRTFDPRETREVRLYLYGGADRVATEGPPADRSPSA